MKKLWWGVVLFVLAGGMPLLRAAELEHWDFTVDGVARSALVHIPARAALEPTPVVFVFHGHGGSSEQAARSFHMEQEWPEAISVYMQGLKTPGQITDPEGRRAGWQAMPGDQGDRDLKFFDAVLRRLEENYEIDTARIYSTGHSNGGGFTYLLWLTRSDVISAVAPSAAAAPYVLRLKPKPAFLLGGKNDNLVKFEWQQAMMKAIHRINGCDAAGQAWEDVCTLYPSQTGRPLVTYIHDGRHQLGPGAPDLIATFFRDRPWEE